MSYYRFVEEPDKAGVSVHYIEPNMDVMTDVFHIPVTLSADVELLNRPPKDERERQSAREAVSKLLRWVNETPTTSEPEHLRYRALRNELLRRQRQ